MKDAADMLLEFERCKKSPYYFMTHYWMVNGKPFTTPLSEEEFNKQFESRLRQYPLTPDEMIPPK